MGSGKNTSVFLPVVRVYEAVLSTLVDPDGDVPEPANDTHFYIEKA